MALRYLAFRCLDSEVAKKNEECVFLHIPKDLFKVSSYFSITI